MRLHYRIGTFALIAALAGCGGKGGDEPGPPAAAVVPVASTLEFPLRAANAALALRGEPGVTLWAKGTADAADVNGMCSGTLVIAATSINFPQPYAGAMTPFTIDTTQTSYTNCSPSTVSTTVFMYYSGSYLPLGSSGVGFYGVWPTPPVYPNMVTVGVAGTVGTELLYTDSSQTSPLGRVDYSFVVEPDTATTAIVNLISKRFDAANQLQYTLQERRRIQQDGTFDRVSWDKEDVAPIARHVIFRR